MLLRYKVSTSHAGEKRAGRQAGMGGTNRKTEIERLYDDVMASSEMVNAHHGSLQSILLLYSTRVKLKSLLCYILFSSQLTIQLR